LAMPKVLKLLPHVEARPSNVERLFLKKTMTRILQFF